MIILCDRHDVLLHRVLTNIYRFFEASNQTIVCYNVTRSRDFLRLFKRKPIGADHVFLQDPLALLIFLFLNPKSRGNIIYFCLEMWGYDVPNSSLFRVFRNVIFRLTNHLALCISPIVVLSNDLRRKFFTDKNPRLINKSFVFENYHMRANKAIQGLGCSEQFLSTLNHIKEKHKVVTCYAGGIQRGRNVFMIASVFDKVSSDACFVVAGEDRIGIPWSSFKKGNVYYLGPISTTEIDRLYGIAQWGFMDYDNTLLNTRYCAPLKLYEYLAYGMGIICNRNYSMLLKRELIDFYYEDEQDLDSILEMLVNSRPHQKDVDCYEFSTKFNELMQQIDCARSLHRTIDK